MNPLLLISILCLAAPSLLAQEGLRLPSIFSDHMVLQRGKPVRIWGKDKPGTKIVVAFDPQEKTAKARLDGSWSLDLDPLKTGKARELVIRGSTVRHIRDVLVGEVWFCSGQSNMEFPVSRSKRAKVALRDATVPGIRLFKVTRRTSQDSHFDVKGGPWKLSSPESVKSFSAVAWYFGRQLHDKLGVPIGLVQSSWGGTRIQSWMSPRTLQDKAFARIREQWKANDQRRAQWQKKKGEEKAPRGRFLPERHRPGGLFLGMAEPILPYGYAGALWYQGEANRKEADDYADYTRRLVLDWRRVSGQKLPFYWVQLAAFHYRDLGSRGLPVMWEAQDKAQDLERTGMASAADIGNPKNIHPTNKTEVGRRLSLLALARVYGRQVEDRGPKLESWKKKGKEIELVFSHCEGSLVAKRAPEGFEVAGSNKKFSPAQARIEGQKIFLTCKEVKLPKAIRYAFHELGPFPVYNQQRLPLTPFRTDNWPVKNR